MTEQYCVAYATIGLLCHSERSGTDIKKQVIKPKNAAESNPEGAPAGGISALVYSIQRIASHPQKEREAALCKKSYLPKHKNFPHAPATLQKQNKSSLPKWRGHGGSSGWVREVWRVVTDFATQNLVNSGFAALDSPSERGLPAPPRPFPYLSRIPSTRAAEGETTQDQFV